MTNKDTTLIMLASVFVTSLVIANVLATKIWVIGSIFIPAGVIAYPITFLLTDVIGEVWGKKTANQVVWAGFFCSILAASLGYLAVWLPAAPFYQHQEAFSSMFGMVGRITVASLIAYIVSQSHDIWLFHFLKERTKGRHLWLRNNLSTMTSQFIDTVLFIAIAFGGVIPLMPLLGMMLGQWSVKIVLALLDTPLCYFFVGIISRRVNTPETVRS